MNNDHEEAFQYTLDCIYEFVKDYIETNGFSPSLREIGEACHLARSSVGRYLDHLQIQQRLAREVGTPRSIRILKDDP